MRIVFVGAAASLSACLTLSAAVITRYDDRARFTAETAASRSTIDFDSVANGQCVALPSAAGVTASGVNFNGGVARLTSSGACSPPLRLWEGYVLTARLLARGTGTTPALTATLPAGVNAVGFQVGLNEDLASSTVEVVVSTSDGDQQTFTVTTTQTGTGSDRRIQPTFVGFTASRNITSVRYRVPAVDDAILVLDNFIFGELAAPVISSTNGVLNGASFTGSIGPNSWVSIFGQRLSAGASRLWQGSDFSGSRLPTAVEDISVTINGRPAYVAYVSPGQLNVLTPADLPEGPATVQVMRGASRSNTFAITIQRVAPALFMFDAEARRYVAANHVNGTPVGKTTLYPGVSSPAAPGEIITLWGTGFGRTDPAIPAGEIVSTATRLIVAPVVTIGGATADVQFAGLTIAGVYQFNVVVPPTLASGDHQVYIQVEGARTQDNAFLTVQR
ncbi:MAG TPA: IPT/TIG domain-containing protein [Bryobacteraceae bacterium]|nr:IPT/TIG domain-containing protein [Bryobacteraceae bacterium]